MVALEKRRKRVIDQYRLDNTDIDHSEYQNIAELARSTLNAPIALITVLSEDKQWFLANPGLEQEATPFEDSFCQYALDNNPSDVLTVPDAKEDKRFRSLSLVQDKPGVRSYAGAPVAAPGGTVFGTICILDTEPRQFTKQECEELKRLAQIVSDKIKQRRRFQKQEQEKQNEKNRRRYLDDVINQIPGVLVVTDTELNVIEVRGDGLEKAGIEPVWPDDDSVPFQEVVGKQQTIHAADCYAALDGHQITSCTKFNGQYYRRITQPFYKDGDIKGTISIGFDITQQYRLQNKLREKHRVLRLMIENINECFWITDTDKDQMLYVSSSFEAIWGIDREKLKANPDIWLEYIHPDDRDRIESLVPEAQLNGTYDVEYRIKRPDGQVRWIHDKAFPVENENGKTQLVGVAEDITKRKKQERTIKKKDKLASIGEMASSIVHEINNPNSFIQGNANYLGKAWSTIQEELSDTVNKTVDGITDGDIGDTIQSIQDGTRRIEKIASDVKRFARESQEVPREKHDLDSIESEIKQTVKKHNEHGKEIIEYSGKLPTDDAKLKMKQNDLVMIANNLIENALDATSSQDDPRVEVIFYEHKDCLCFQVKDNGEGMPDKVANQVTEPFFSTKDKNHGTGLGLAIVSTIVEKAGGGLNIDTDKGDGTTITIALPMY